MDPCRIVVYGNAGSGKTSMARALSARLGVPHLDLDTIAWQSPAVRKELAASIAELRAFIDAHPGWVIEGCYGDLIEAALPWCSELRFLNPGVAACVRNCRGRPWEPHKFATPEDQDHMLAVLLPWVEAYETRGDEFSLARHRALFDGFAGPKREFGDERVRG
jgi:hypothetical protein